LRRELFGSKKQGYGVERLREFLFILHKRYDLYLSSSIVSCDDIRFIFTVGKLQEYFPENRVFGEGKNCGSSPSEDTLGTLIDKSEGGYAGYIGADHTHNPLVPLGVNNECGVSRDKMLQILGLLSLGAEPGFPLLYSIQVKDSSTFA